jgi:hypothetical protein
VIGDPGDSAADVERERVDGLPVEVDGAHDLSEGEERDAGEGADRDRVDRAADAEPLRQVARHVEAAAPDARTIRELAEGDDLHRVAVERVTRERIDIRHMWRTMRPWIRRRST